MSGSKRKVNLSLEKEDDPEEELKFSPAKMPYQSKANWNISSKHSFTTSSSLKPNVISKQSAIKLVNASFSPNNNPPPKSGPWRFDRQNSNQEEPLSFIKTKEPEIITIGSSSSEEEDCGNNNSNGISDNYLSPQVELFEGEEGQVIEFDEELMMPELPPEVVEDESSDELHWAIPEIKAQPPGQFITHANNNASSSGTSSSYGVKKSVSTKPKPKRNRNRKRDKSELASILAKPAKRACFSFAQYEALYTTWEITQSPHISEIRELVHITGLTLEQVKNWFKNRRRLDKEKTEKDERGLLEEDYYSGLKAPRKFTTVRRRVSDSSLNTSNSASSHKPSSKNHETGSSSSSRRSHTSSTQDSTSTNIAKLSEKDKRTLRLNAVKSTPVVALEECMEDNKTRLSQLVLMYMKKKLDMTKTLLRETAKLKERIVRSPFTSIQLNAMTEWLDEFFREVEEGLKEDKRQKLEFAKSNVIHIWQPVIIYGKLKRVSLEVAIQDFFHLNEVDKSVIADTEEFTVPGILRYMESHFN